MCVYACMSSKMYVCMCVYVYMCMFACLQVCMCACVHVCMHVCMYACVWMRTYFLPFLCHQFRIIHPLDSFIRGFWSGWRWWWWWWGEGGYLLHLVVTTQINHFLCLHLEAIRTSSHYHYHYNYYNYYYYNLCTLSSPAYHSRSVLPLCIHGTHIL